MRPGGASCAAENAGRPSLRRFRRSLRGRVRLAGAVALAILVGACPSSGTPRRGTTPPADLSGDPARAIALAPAALRGGVFPLELGPTGRYLVDQRNVPFLIVGDSPQSLIVDLSEKDARYFLAARRAEGFNTVWINLLCNSYTGGRPDGSTYDGIRPFNVPGDLSTANERYFARADAVIRFAARLGLLVFLDPIETGGWRRVLLGNGVAKAYEYGRYLGDRYRKFPNVVWLSGNDFQSWRNGADDAVAIAFERCLHAFAEDVCRCVRVARQHGHCQSEWFGHTRVDHCHRLLPLPPVS